jgi:hypothetical protein
MSYYATHYRSGEEIRVGDHIAWAGTPGRVLFVLGSVEVPAEGVGSTDWYAEEFGEGFMLDVAGIGWVFEAESDEDLDFLRRKQ